MRISQVLVCYHKVAFYLVAGLTSCDTLECGPRANRCSDSRTTEYKVQTESQVFEHQTAISSYSTFPLAVQYLNPEAHKQHYGNTSNPR